MRQAGRIIIIDEASMIGRGMADVIQNVAELYKKKLVLVGDWAQACPVQDEWPFQTELFNKATVIKLDENHRQADKEFMDALEEVRRGTVGAVTTALFQSRAAAVDDGRIRLYATNKLADERNLNELRKLYKQVGGCWSRLMTTIESKYQMTEAEEKRNIEMSKLAHDQPIVPGCRVLFTWNDPGGEWVNGDMGTVVSISFKENTKVTKYGVSDKRELGAELDGRDVVCVAIRMDRFDHEIKVERTTIPVKGVGGFTLYTLQGFPFRLGYALTIHKAQGATLDKVYVNMSSIRNMMGGRHGLAYVALSRTRTLDGLALDSFEQWMVDQDAAVLDTRLI